MGGVSPKVKRPAVVAEIYWKAKKKIDAGEIPTLLIQTGQTLYRSVNPNSAHTLLPMPKPGMQVSRVQANKLLIPADDGIHERDNRYSGPSPIAGVPPAAGLYCVLQQQALVNESIHYSGRAGPWALSGRGVLKMRVIGDILVADLSPHTPQARRFIRALGTDIWEQMVDYKDCSVARGIGLAVGQSSYLRGLTVQTVRTSERSADERGDNLVLYTLPGRAISGIRIEEVYYFEKTNVRSVFPVAFP